MDYFNHRLAASASAPAQTVPVESGFWWTRGRSPADAPGPSTPPRDLSIDNTMDRLPDASAGLNPSSPAAMFLLGFTAPSHIDVNPSASRSSSLPNKDNPSSPTEVLQRPHLTRLSISFQDDETSVIAGYQLGPIIGHGAFSTVRRATAVPSDSLSSSYTGVVAVKIVRRNDPRPGASEARLRLANEAKIWSQLSHEHVLPLFKTEETPEATFLFTLLCPAGSLLDVINQHKADGLEGVGMDDAGMLFRQIVRGLRYLHEVVRLVHGDIKLDNVLVDDEGSCRIADFGLSKWMAPDHHHTAAQEPKAIEASEESGPPSPSPSPAPAPHGLPVHLSLLRTRGRHQRPTNSPFNRHPPTKAHTTSESAGSPDPNQSGHLPTHPQHWFPPGSLPYAAPELLAPHLMPLPPNPAQDIWALGCVLYALLFGKLPFSDPFEPRLQMKIVRGIWKLPSNCRMSNGLSRSKARRSSSRSGGNTRSRSGSRSRLGTTNRRRPGSSGKGAGGIKSPTSAAFVTNFPHGPGMRSKSRGRSRPNSGRGRARSVSPPNSSPKKKTIGRVAENVLHGCLCVNQPDRWTVEMIDEVGWGVGWDLDVDEAGEEFHEHIELDDESSGGTASTTTSVLTTSSVASSRVGRVGVVAVGDAERDEFGNRYYIAPASPVPLPSGSRRTSSTLFSSTLHMVTSPVVDNHLHHHHHAGSVSAGGLATVLEAAFGSSSEAVDKVVPDPNPTEEPKTNLKKGELAETSVAVKEVDETDSSSREKDEVNKDSKPTRARGKRGKTSRSSSRPSTSAGTPAASVPVPPPSHEADPFYIFRQGHIPASFSQLQTFSRSGSRTASSSRTSSSAPSAVGSRASSRERDGGAKLTLRGRLNPTAAIPAAGHRRAESQSSTSAGMAMIQSASCPFPRTSGSLEHLPDAWKLSSASPSPPCLPKNAGRGHARSSSHSASPGSSPSPSTPMDGSVIINKDRAGVSMRRSPSRGRGRAPVSFSIGGRSSHSLEEARMGAFAPRHASDGAGVGGVQGKAGLSPPDTDHEEGEVRGAVARWPWG